MESRIVDDGLVTVCRDRRADGGRDELPDDGRADEQHDRDHVLLGLPAHDGTRNRRAELGAEHRTADEADEAQRADDKALPVAGDRERGGQNDQGEIKQITAHASTVSGQRRPVGQRADGAGIPRALEAAQREQSVRQQRGESPDQHRADAERGPAVPAREPQHEPVGRVGQVGHADPLDRRDLADVGRPDRARRPPPAQHRDDPELAARR